MMKLRSIKSKLLLAFTILMLVICFGLGLLSYSVAKDALVTKINDTLLDLSTEAARVVHESIKVQLNGLEVLAATDAISGNSTTDAQKMEILKKEAERSGHLSITIVDASGNAKTTNGETTNVKDMDYFIESIAGKSAVSDPVLSKISGDLIVFYSVPIKDQNNNITGVLAAVRDGNELSSITQSIRLDAGYSSYMINSSGTTIANANKEFVTEMYNIFEQAKNNPELAELESASQKMVSGNMGVSEYSYNGTNYLGYAPVAETDWSLAITAPREVVMSPVNNLITTITVISVVFILIGMVLTYIIASSITKPIKDASNYLEVVASGDFTGEISMKLLENKDETGALSRSIQSMQGSIKSIVFDVIRGSEQVETLLLNINDNMKELNQSIEEISATTEELSAEVEEVASATEEMSATSTEIENAVNSIAIDAQEGVVTINNVSSMASDMKSNATESKNTAVEIYGKAKTELKEEIEQSRAVNQINELAQGILAITSQTNLLSLNAAIEAARAGEAGNGFAVVANEIKMLAEDSKNMANRIQEVTKEITLAVENLATSSSEILGFIDQKVLYDYDVLVQTSAEYSENSISIDQMMSSFSATSEELLASVHYMTKAIGEISTSINEEANGTSNIAQEVVGILKKSTEVIDLSKSAKERANILAETVSQFKV